MVCSRYLSCSCKATYNAFLPTQPTLAPPCDRHHIALEAPSQTFFEPNRTIGSERRIAVIFPAIPKRIQSALKALCSLAEASQPLRANQVAKQIGVPPAETAKVLQLLSWGGFVNSRRGTKGGFWLTEPPQQILAGKVISFLDTHRDSSTGYEDKCGQALRALSAQCQRKLQCLTVADLASGRVACASRSSARKAGSK